MGRDIPTRPRPCAPGHFNPRAPYGARPATGAEKQSSLNFNPRARVGRDGTSSSRCKDRRLSIHAPAWGATPSRDKDIADYLISIHAPAWGATRILIECGVGLKISIHAPRVGRDNAVVLSQKATDISIHAPRVGRD